MVDRSRDLPALDNSQGYPPVDKTLGGPLVNKSPRDPSDNKFQNLPAAIKISGNCPNKMFLGDPLEPRKSSVQL